MEITRSSKSRKYGDVTVWFDKRSGYYAHGIKGIGKEEDGHGVMNTAWRWAHHLREKNWWHEQLEQRFIREVSKYF